MADTSVETKRCSNCKRDIASSNFFLHDAHCRKNIVLCDVCNEPVSRSEMEEHLQEWHAPVKCELCSSMLERDQIEEHKENGCPKRLVKCPYCNLEMPACDNDNHEEYCGSRTEPCTKCHQYIMYKDLKKHEQSGCSFPACDKDRNEHKSNSRSNIRTKNRMLNHVTDFSANNYVVDEITEMLSRTAMSGNHEMPSRNNVLYGNSHGRGIVLSNILRNNTRKASIRPGLGSEKVNTLKDSKNICRERENRDTAHHSNIDYRNADWLLAQQMENMEGEEVGEVPFLNDNGADDDNVTLPCEYCHKGFSLEDFIMHQTICKPEGVPAVNVYDDNMDYLGNNRTEDTGSQRTNIINDLSFEAAENRLLDHTFSGLHQASELDDETVLPCEFCGELFPYDILTQHQVVCKDNSPPRQGGQRESNQTRPRPRSRSRDQGPMNRSSYQDMQHKTNNQLRGRNHSGYNGASKPRPMAAADALPNDRNRLSSGKKSSKVDRDPDIPDNNQAGWDGRASNHPNRRGYASSKRWHHNRSRVARTSGYSWNSMSHTTHQLQEQDSYHQSYRGSRSNYNRGARGRQGMPQRPRGGSINRFREGTVNHHYNIQDYSSRLGERGTTSNVTSAQSGRNKDGPSSTNRQPAVSGVRRKRYRNPTRGNHDNSSENRYDSWEMHQI